MDGKILVFSDIHGDKMAMEAIWRAKEAVGAASLFSLGDLCPDPGDPVWRGITGVRGNMDRWYQYGDLPFPPRERSFFWEGRTVYAFHGNEIPSFSPEKGDIVMSGHTHIPSFRNKDGVFYVNPGSASQPRTSLPPSFALLSAECFTLFSLLDLSIISRRSFSSSQ